MPRPSTGLAACCRVICHVTGRRGHVVSSDWRKRRPTTAREKREVTSSLNIFLMIAVTPHRNVRIAAAPLAPHRRALRVQAAALATPTRVWTRQDATAADADTDFGLDTRGSTTPRTQPRPSRNDQPVYDYNSDDDDESGDQDDGEEVVRGPPRLRRVFAAGAARRALEF